jgi:phage baseplate assembly protein W
MTLRQNKYTQNRKQQEIFSDFLLSFETNDNTKDLVRNINALSIQSALKNIILTNKGERLYQGGLGGSIRDSLFELFETSTVEFMKQNIEKAIETYEPRVKYEDAVIVPSEDNNGIFVTIYYSTVQQPGLTQNLTVFLERVR